MSETTEKLSPFQKWYQNGGKDKLAERRRKRYHEDPQYRERCLKSSATSRRDKRREEANIPKDAYTHAQVAEKLGVTQATMRTWRMRDYFPEPLIANGRLYFTEGQIALLRDLAAFFKEKPRRRLSAPDKARLDNIISVILVNW